jgi:MoxR-like ATPase
VSTWPIFKGTGQSDPDRDPLKDLPEPPDWRDFAAARRDQKRGQTYRYSKDGRELDQINAALFLRRPLLVTGRPGTGKSSLAYSIAEELGIGPVLKWAITTRSTLADGLYKYDAIARLQDAQLLRDTDDAVPAIGRYLRLGPLGTALLPSERPRLLLIDEIDKSDIDLPNDLLHVFEEGAYEIPEIARYLAHARQSGSDATHGVEVTTDDGKPALLTSGSVQCQAFPMIVLTSNGERDFPPAFLRRCIQLDIKQPDKESLAAIVQAHLGADLGKRAMDAQVSQMIAEFAKRTEGGESLSTDQLLNAIYITTRDIEMTDQIKDRLKQALQRPLDSRSPA